MQKAWLRSLLYQKKKKSKIWSCPFWAQIQLPIFFQANKHTNESLTPHLTPTAGSLSLPLNKNEDLETYTLKND